LPELPSESRRAQERLRRPEVRTPRARPRDRLAKSTGHSLNVREDILAGLDDLDATSAPESEECLLRRFEPTVRRLDFNQGWYLALGPAEPVRWLGMTIRDYIVRRINFSRGLVFVWMAGMALCAYLCPAYWHSSKTHAGAWFFASHCFLAVRRRHGAHGPLGAESRLPSLRWHDRFCCGVRLVPVHPLPGSLR
jgi:hypothetical protein